MKNKKFMNWLNDNGACKEGMKNVGNQTLEEFYNSCKRGDWLFWWIRRAINQNFEGYPKLIDYKKAAIECAKLALPYTKNPRVKTLLQEIENYVNGDNSINIIELRKEARNIKNTATAAEAAAAAYAAYAAEAAAYAAAAAAVTEKEKIQEKTAEIVRQYLKIDFTKCPLNN